MFRIENLEKAPNLLIIKNSENHVSEDLKFVSNSVLFTEHRET